jgi:hypothetical protein
MRSRVASVPDLPHLVAALASLAAGRYAPLTLRGSEVLEPRCFAALAWVHGDTSYFYLRPATLAPVDDELPPVSSLVLLLGVVHRVPESPMRLKMVRKTRALRPGSPRARQWIKGLGALLVRGQSPLVGRGMTVINRLRRAEPGRQPPGDQPGNNLNHVGSTGPTWDGPRYWVALHTSGVTSVQIRILDCMLGSTRSTGQVALSMGRIAIGAASSQVTSDLRRLMTGGWLRIVRPFDPIEMTPTLYALTFPPEATDMSGPGSGAPLPGVDMAAMLLLGREWLRRLQEGDWEGCLGGHDAFRRAKGTLNAAYPILTLLTDAPTSVELLASWLRMPERRVRDHAQDLVRAGLATLTTTATTGPRPI